MSVSSFCIGEQEIAALRYLSFLPPEDLAKASCVDKEWKRLASTPVLWEAFDLKALFPRLSIIDRSVWEAHVDLVAAGLRIEDAIIPSKRVIYPVLKRLFRSLVVEGGKGISLVTMPEGFSLRKIREFALTSFQYLNRRILEAHGDTPVVETHLVAITNGLLEGSRDLPLAAHEALTAEKGCEIPGVLDIITLAILTEKSSSIRLYSNDPETFSRCRENIGGDSLFSGRFSLAGLHVNYYSYEGPTDGVAALKRIRRI